jgi:hypothetical protein
MIRFDQMLGSGTERAALSAALRKHHRVLTATLVEPRTRPGILELYKDAIICIVSHHGFAPIAHDVNLAGAFIQARLISVDDKGKVTGWAAEPWFSGGSAAIMLRQPDDNILKQKVRDLLGTLRDDPANGMTTILNHEEIVARGGNPVAAFYVGFKASYEMGPDPSKPLIARAR